MRVSFVSFLALLAGLAAAQGPNAFNTPPGGFTGFAAGKSETLTWSNLQGSTVTILLRQGAAGNLGQGTTIASKIPNKGTYTWQVPSSIVNGDGYALEIIDDDDPNLNNFTPQFSISSSNTVSSSASSTAAASTSGTSSAKSSKTSNSSSMTSSAASTGTSSSATGASASASPSPSNNAAPMMELGGSLLAMGVAFAVAL